MLASVILIIKLGALGDFVLADAAFHTLYTHHKSNNPRTRMVLLTTPAFKGFAQQQGYFDEIITLPRFNYANLYQWYQLLKIFQRLRPTHIYDVQLVKRTRIYARVFEVYNTLLRHSYTWVGHVKHGMLNGKLSPLTRYISLDHAFFAKHPLERYQSLVEQAGIPTLAPLNITRLGARHPIFNTIQRPNRSIVVIPGTSNAFGGAKKWPLDHYQTLVRMLCEDGYTCILVGGPQEDNTSLCVHERVIDLTGQTRFEHIIDLAQHAVCAIGGDTGPIHMAAASQCPVFVMFSKKAPPASQVGARGPHFHHMSVDDLTQLTPDTVKAALDLFIDSIKMAV